MKVLVIEGQGNFPIIRNKLIEPMRARGHEFSVDYLLWQALGHRVPYDLIIGHSLGGHTAIKFAALNPQATVLSLDPRWQSAASYFDFLIPFMPNFKAPAGSKIFNFYQKLPLPGYAVEGAKLNKFVISTHGGIPGNAHVVAWLDAFLRSRA